jgi:uncharacterized protein
MPNPITWFEINGPEPAKTAEFYSALFGWHMETMPDGGYTLIDTHAGAGANGGIGGTEPGTPAHAIFYVENPDIQSLLDRATGLGAATAVPVTVIPDMVTYAQFTDPFGNLIGLVQGDGTTNVSAGDNPPVDWFECMCSEPERAWGFYVDLFGWTITGSKGGGFVHGGVETGGAVRGGIGSSPDGRPHVVLYARVPDLEERLERAVALGGAVAVPPMQVDDHTRIAAFTDPQGTMFGIYTAAR